MSEPKIIKKLKTEVVKYFDNYIEDFDKKIKTAEKAKKEVLNNKGDLQTILDMFANNNIEIVSYDTGGSFKRKLEYSFIKPYAEIKFVVKKPDNDVLLNIRARYACYEGKFNIDGKYVSRRITGYELVLPGKGADAVPEKSAMAKSIKECINILKNKYDMWHLPSVDLGPPDKIEDELFFYMINNLLSIKTSTDVKKFKNLTALEIKDGIDTINAANNLCEKRNSYCAVFR
jgi:hypothetical protein